MRLERWMSVLRLRVRSLFFRHTVDRELDDELAITWIDSSNNTWPAG